MDLKKEDGSSEHSDTHPGGFVRGENNNNISAYPMLRVRLANSDDRISYGSESSRTSGYNSDETDASSRSEHLEPIMEEQTDAAVRGDHNFFHPNDDNPRGDGKINNDNLNKDNQLYPVATSRSSSSSSSSPSSSSASRSKRLEPKLLHPENVDDNKKNNDLNKDDKLMPVSVSRSSSLSSLASSEDDLFEVNAIEGFNPREYAMSLSESHEDTQPASKDQETGFSGDDSHKLDGNAHTESPIHALTSQVHNTNPFLDPSPSPVKNGANGPSGSNVSPMQSPPVQVMQHPKGYDPSRIPSSIFEKSKSKGAQDWSTCSNESLFSIHVGNNSFSQDVFLFRSGELNPGEFLEFDPLRPPGSVDFETQPITPRPLFESKVETFKQDKIAAIKAAHEPIQDADRFPEVRHGETRISPMSSRRSSRRSCGSADSAYSFAFPILTETATHSSQKDETGEQQLLQPQEVAEQQQQPPKPATPKTPKSDTSRWLNCFSCCSHCPWCRCCNHRCNCCCCSLV